MKKLLFAVVLSLAIPMATHAAEPWAGAGNRPESVNQRVQLIAEELNLTEEQKVQVRAIFKEQFIKSKAVRDEAHARLEAVLTESQLAQLDALIKKGYRNRSGKPS